ncbi:putative pentatricopeptide repeat-containing protein At5g37570 [Prunus avium]|uniref:Pentatricopeptide repeat-containing protein At5g37570 n=1 Tax=Prunus avium TaxID=42229 RepID=A0A6P5T4G8_PRUAV|nr:putative pentatricopeptide repeat-containing protein At5g37570 [Prunus avium]
MHEPFFNPMPTIGSCSSLASPNSLPSSFLASIATLLKACKTQYHLQQVHAQIIHKGLEQDCFLITQFICLSNTLSSLSYSTAIFDSVHSPSTFLWNTLIKGYCERSSFADTVGLFVRMKREEGVPDRYTYPSLVKACASEAKVWEGRAIHGSAVRCGVDGDVFVSTSLIDLYGKCREILCARKVFDGMSERNVVSWTAMVVGYASVGDLDEAHGLFDQMPQRNVVSWNVIISGFVKLGDLTNARRIFDQMPEKNVVSFTTMVDGYAKYGDMASARFLFDQAPNKDIVAWSALISGYAQNGQPNEALKIFLEMSTSNVKPDEFIMVSLMSACSQVGCLQVAKWVDSYLSQSSIDVRQDHVIAALIDMNAKCGNMERATSLFEAMPKQDMISYCSMIQGLSVHGRGYQAVALFNKMLNEGLAPDEVAFTVILTACSRAGLVEQGWHFFESMRRKYHLTPSPDHYACMVDLLSRLGRLNAAYDLLKSMPMEPHAGAWGALLGACKLNGNIELGELVANRLFEIEPLNPGNYVLLSNIYAAADRWFDVSAVRDKMEEQGIKKISGCSWISSKG